MSTFPLLQDHFDDPYHRGSSDMATHSAEASVADCELRVELVIDDDIILEAWFDGAGCPNCEGLASVLAQQIEGSSRADYTLEPLLRSAGIELEPFHELSKSQACLSLPSELIVKAFSRPLIELDDDLTDGTQFGGPSLREEC